MTFIGAFRRRDVCWTLQTSRRLLEPSDIVTSNRTFRRSEVLPFQRERKSFNVYRGTFKWAMQWDPPNFVTSCLSIGTFRSRDVYWNLQTWWRLSEPSSVVTSIGTFKRHDVLEPSNVVMYFGTFRRCDVFWNFKTSWRQLEPSRRGDVYGNLQTSWRFRTFKCRDV